MKRVDVVTEDMGFTAGGNLLPAVADVCEAVRERFWSKVDKSPSDSGCWLWNACTEEDGYGLFRFAGRMIAAHRFSFALANGRWCPSSRVILHSCDNPACVNPDHLSEGNLSENLTEAWARGRRSGTVLWRDSSLTPIRRGKSSLSEWDVTEIRRRRAKGEKVAKLAEAFQVRPATIRDCTNGRTFQHIPTSFPEMSETEEETSCPSF